MKVALVHDYLLYFGGAERTLQVLCQIYPEAPIYTLLFNEEKMRKFFPKAEIRCSFLQKFPKFLRRRHKYLLPFYPSAIESFDLREFDLVISSSSAFAKGVIVKPKTVHIAYIHSPMRFIWDYYYNYLKEQKLIFAKSLIARAIIHYLRIWDVSSAERPDYLIANSKSTASRIKKIYRRQSAVIYPPVYAQEFDLDAKNIPEANQQINESNYFLIVSRLSPYKKIDVAISAFNKLGLSLIIIGEGSDKNRLEKMAEKNIKFLGWIEDGLLKEYYKNCLAFIFPQEEDFGIAAAEAMNFGKPILAYRGGGALEIVKEGETGEFFDDQTVEVLADGVRRLRENLKTYDSKKIKKQTEKFSKKKFMEEIRKYIHQRITNSL